MLGSVELIEPLADVELSADMVPVLDEDWLEADGSEVDALLDADGSLDCAVELEVESGVVDAVLGSEVDVVSEVLPVELEVEPEAVVLPDVSIEPDAVVPAVSSGCD